MTDQRCGTCMWWDHIGDYDVGPLGSCEWPKSDFPDALVFMRWIQTIDDEGTDCPCWQEKTDG
jgi:hypothetical protein